jgi:hypothetical protein
VADILCRLAARDSLTTMRRTGVALVIACLPGISVGVGAFTLVHAKGFSYLSTDPRVCVNPRRAATATTDGQP